MDNNFDLNSCSTSVLVNCTGSGGQDTQVNIGKLLRTKANITVGACER